MIERSSDRVGQRRWLICESGQRWQIAAGRFAPQLMPPALVPSITSADPQPTIQQLSALSDQTTVVLWESAEGSLLPVCEWLMQAARVCPKALQLVAATVRSDRERSILLELPCAAIVRHPEDLPRLQSMIRSHFGDS